MPSLNDLISGECGEEDGARLLQQIRQRGETAVELADLVRHLRVEARQLPTKHMAVLDLCGTGGAPFRTFNVSTIAAIVASARFPVAKHGNISHNGICGSADMLTALGADVRCSSTASSKALDCSNFCFLFAPDYHPAMARVAGARRKANSRTIFNLAGPLLNPVRSAHRQLIGVGERKHLRTVAEACAFLRMERAMVVHGRPGMDEISASAPTLVIEVHGDRLEEYYLDPGQLGMGHVSEDALRELHPQQSAALCRRILNGERMPQREAVILNTAAALYVAGAAPSIESGLGQAESIVDNGKAAAQLQRYLENCGAGI
jgi:anthranilate phosphoribosyltransferase